MAVSPTTLFPNESDEDIYLRLADDLGNPPGGEWSLREGSQIYTLLKPLVFEHRRFYGFAEFVNSLGFLEFSQGSWLDAKASEFGVVRSEAVAATLIMTFNGTDGTFIPAGTVISTETPPDQFDSISFVTDEDLTIGVSGTAQVTATAQVAGLSGNVGAGDLNIVNSSIIGLESALNEVAGTGGLDVEDDESLRTKALFRARALPQAGNKATYSIIALTNPEVETVYVEDFWDQNNGLTGNGTGRVIIGGGLTPYVSTDTVEELQQQIDPTIMNIAHFENEIWSGGTEDTSTPIEGQASRSITAGASTAVAMTLTKTLNLLAFDDNVNDEIWLGLKRTTASGNLAVSDALKITFFVPGGTAVAKAEATITAATINALDDITIEGLLKVVKGDFTITNGSGTFTWDNIAGLTLTLKSSGSGLSTVVFDGMRIRRGKGGFPTGEATMGVQITVRSARTLGVVISANVALQPGLIVSDVLTLVTTNITSYLNSLVPGSTVRITEIGNAIHDALGVIDYDTILINTVAANLVLLPDQRPVLSADPTLTLV